MNRGGGRNWGSSRPQKAGVEGPRPPPGLRTLAEDAGDEGGRALREAGAGGSERRPRCGKGIREWAVEHVA